MSIRVQQQLARNACAAKTKATTSTTQLVSLFEVLKCGIEHQKQQTQTALQLQLAEPSDATLCHLADSKVVDISAVEKTIKKDKDKDTLWESFLQAFGLFPGIEKVKELLTILENLSSTGPTDSLIKALNKKLQQIKTVINKHIAVKNVEKMYLENVYYETYKTTLHYNKFQALDSIFKKLEPLNISKDTLSENKQQIKELLQELLKNAFIEPHQYKEDTLLQNIKGLIVFLQNRQACSTNLFMNAKQELLNIIKNKIKNILEAQENSDNFKEELKEEADKLKHMKINAAMHLKEALKRISKILKKIGFSEGFSEEYTSETEEDPLL